jgi:hypothetical protein
MECSNLLSPSGRARALEQAHDLGERLIGRETSDPSLASGDAGLALMFHELSQRFADERFDRAAKSCLARVVDGLVERPLGPGLFDGLAGVAWVLCFISPNVDREPLDAALLAALCREHWCFDFDLGRGLVGIGVYALERLRRGGSADMLKRVVAALLRSAQPDGEGLTWRTRPEFLHPDDRFHFPNGRYDLGMAHGVPSVLAFLAICGRLGMPDAEAAVLRAAHWLQRQCLNGGGLPRYPKCVGASDPVRSAWCYGDPGVALAWARAGAALQRPEWIAFARRLAINSCVIAAEDGRVHDRGLCHGAAGLALICFELYRRTNDDALLRAGRRWLEDRAIDMTFGTASSPSSSVFNGDAGVVLALLAATQPMPPAWGRLLLLND